VKIFNSKTIELSADDLRLILIKKFMDQFDRSEQHAIEVSFVIDRPNNGILKGVKISGKTCMEI
jgi:hypothetical protein